MSVPDKCPHCERELDDEEKEMCQSWGPLVCPECQREGCEECIMVSGRGCPCVDCDG